MGVEIKYFGRRLQSSHGLPAIVVAPAVCQVDG